jgi:hypothetical protein
MFSRIISQVFSYIHQKNNTVSFVVRNHHEVVSLRKRLGMKDSLPLRNRHSITFKTLSKFVESRQISTVKGGEFSL